MCEFGSTLSKLSNKYAQPSFESDDLPINISLVLKASHDINILNTKAHILAIKLNINWV